MKYKEELRKVIVENDITPLEDLYCVAERADEEIAGYKELVERLDRLLHWWSQH